LKKIADSVLDLQMNTPEWVDARAVNCSSQLTYFDPLTGYLQFTTHSATSRNTWVQTVLFNEWDNVVTVEHETQEEAITTPRAPSFEERKMPWGPLYTKQPEKPLPEGEEALEEEMIPEPTVEAAPPEEEELPWGPLIENAIKPNDTWETVLGKYPELINVDVRVNCGCQFFTYYGPAYNLEQRDTAEQPQGVPAPHDKSIEFPRGRGPQAWSNIICKHLAAVFNQHF